MYPRPDIDRPLNEAAADKIRDYRDDYNNRPSNDLTVTRGEGRLLSQRRGRGVVTEALVSALRTLHDCLFLLACDDVLICRSTQTFKFKTHHTPQELR